MSTLAKASSTVRTAAFTFSKRARQYVAVPVSCHQQKAMPVVCIARAVLSQSRGAESQSRCSTRMMSLASRAVMSAEVGEGVEAPVEDAVEEAAPAEEEAAPPPPNRQFKDEPSCFVGNLPWSVDNDVLRELFSEYNITSCNVVYDAATGQSRGFAFVNFEDDASCVSACEQMTGIEVEGRTLTVEKKSGTARPRSERPKRDGPYQPRQRDDDDRRLYIGNLAWELEDADLFDLFQEFGDVQQAAVMYFKDTGRSRGFGFVTMMKPEDAVSAAEELNGQIVNGRNVRVNLAAEGRTQAASY